MGLKRDPIQLALKTIRLSSKTLRGIRNIYYKKCNIALLKNKTKNKKAALFGVLTNNCKAIKKTGLYEKKTFLEFDNLLFWVMMRVLWK